MLLGNGAGEFNRLLPDVEVGKEPYSVLVGDFNNDLFPDLAVANTADDTISVLLGDGSGKFSGKLVSVSPSPYWLAAADLDGDLNLDLAVNNFNSEGVGVLRGNGSGGFGTLSNFSVGKGTFPHAVALGDFNGDRKLDLAVSLIKDTKTVGVLLGNGAGGFGEITTFPVDNGPHSIVLADFNADQKLDLAVTNRDSDTVSVLLGDGSGGFGINSEFPVGRNPHGLAVGDFNADQKLDLVVADRLGNAVSILLNQSQ